MCNPRWPERTQPMTRPTPRTNRTFVANLVLRQTGTRQIPVGALGGAVGDDSSATRRALVDLTSHGIMERRAGSGGPVNLSLGINDDKSGTPPEEPATDAIDCVDYRAHQTHHRFVASSWVCDACAGKA